jgi:hypothetical protein
MPEPTSDAAKGLAAKVEKLIDQKGITRRDFLFASQVGGS